MSNARLLFVAAFLAVSSARVSSGRDDLTVGTISRNYEQSLLALSRFTIHANTDYKDLVNDGWTVSHAITVHRDGDRWRIVDGVTARKPGKNRKFEENKSVSEALFQKGAMVRAVVDPAGGKSTGALAIRTGIDQERRVMLEPSLRFLVLGELQFDEGMPIHKVLLQEGKPMAADQSTGRPLVSLNRRNEFGTYSFLFEPSTGRLVSVRHQKQNTDLARAGVSLKAFSPNPKYPLEVLDLQLGISDYRQAGPHWYPSLFTLTESISFSNQSAAERGRVECRVDEIIVDPAFPKGTFDLSHLLADGTPVTMQEETAVDYEWRDGWIRKKVDENTLSRLRGLKFWTGSWLGRGILSLLLLSLLLFGYTRVRHRRRARNG